MIEVRGRFPSCSPPPPSPSRLILKARVPQVLPRLSLPGLLPFITSIWLLIQILPIELYVAVTGFEHILDVIPSLLERDIAVRVEAFVRDPGVHLTLPRVICRQHQPLIAVIPALYVT